jgi:ring-1,2-phenylacetyl-CoA epoxidase subunit PaaE
MSDFHKLTVKNIIKETANAVSVLFDIPENLKSVFKFDAGQYITLKAKINGEEIRRAYSICSTPKSGDLKVAIKAVEKGAFSQYAISQLKVGDVLEVMPPEGNFKIKIEANKNYIALAAGSGITPIMSIIKSVLEEDSSTFTLIYGNKSADETIFKAELDKLNSEKDNFNLHYIFSRERTDEALFGRIDTSIVNFHVKNKYKDISFDSAYLCGPEEMINQVSDALKAGSFSEENIYFELFTSSAKEENLDKIKEGFTEITVMLDDEETTFVMQQTDNILAASLRNNLDAPYSCQGGVCSSCLAKVTEGKAVMIKNSILTDGEVAEGLILTCQAHPTSPKITIDYDDV